MKFIAQTDWITLWGKQFGFACHLSQVNTLNSKFNTYNELRSFLPQLPRTELSSTIATVIEWLDCWTRPKKT